MKRRNRIINTGSHLPKPTRIQQMQFIERWNRIIPPRVHRQSRRDGTVIFGARAVNRLLGLGFERPTHDFDVFSGMPRKHAVELERHIDRSTGTDMAHVKQLPHPTGKGLLFRVETIPDGDTEVDYTRMPHGIKFVTKHGVRYETLGRAEQKYKRMIRSDEPKRIFHGHLDLNRIRTHRLIRRGL